MGYKTKLALKSISKENLDFIGLKYKLKKITTLKNILKIYDYARIYNIQYVSLW